MALELSAESLEIRARTDMSCTPQAPPAWDNSLVFQCPTHSNAGFPRWCAIPVRFSPILSSELEVLPQQSPVLFSDHSLRGRIFSASLAAPLAEGFRVRLFLPADSGVSGSCAVHTAPGQSQFSGRQSISLKNLGAVIAHPGTYESPTEGPTCRGSGRAEALLQG